MEHLPPVGWAGVATKRDLDQLEERLNSRFEALDSRFEALDSRFEALDSRFEAKLEASLSAQTRTMAQWFVFGTLAAVLAVATLAFAAARFV